jgi:hypothetical protein
MERVSEGHEVACYLFDRKLTAEQKEPLPGKVHLEREAPADDLAIRGTPEAKAPAAR